MQGIRINIRGKKEKASMAWPIAHRLLPYILRIALIMAIKNTASKEHPQRRL